MVGTSFFPSGSAAGESKRGPDGGLLFGVITTTTLRPTTGGSSEATASQRVVVSEFEKSESVFARSQEPGS